MIVTNRIKKYLIKAVAVSAGMIFNDGATEADCLISLHWDGDGQSHDKGCFYIPVPDEIKDMEPVSLHWN